jgi:transposase
MSVILTNMTLEEALRLSQKPGDECRVLREMLQAKDEALHLMEEQIKLLTNQVAWLKRQMFGSKSERIDPNQTYLDGLMIQAIEQNPPAAPEPAGPESVVEAHTRRASPCGRGELPQTLPREVIVHDLPESEKVLPDGTPRPCIGHEDTERLAYTPGRFFVKVIRRPKYGSPAGAEENGVVIAPAPERLVPRCLADESLLAHVVVSKYADHLPAYRLENMFKRSGVEISRQTICRWAKECGLALGLLAGEIKNRLFETGMVHFDDTPVDLLESNPSKPNGRRIRESRFWVARATPRDGPWTVFDFTVSRAADGPLAFFKGYSGKITCDAYAVHDKLVLSADGVTDESRLYGCWAHTRRYFFDAHKSDAPRVGAEFLAIIKELFLIERDIADEDAKTRLAMRRERSLPVLAVIRAKLDALLPGTPPKSGLGKALAYANTYWSRLIRFVEDPQAGIDNNPAENAIRPIALGRKNWLFIGDRDAGRAAANLLTIITTCKNAKEDPYAYLLDVMQRMPLMTTDEVSSLIPERWVPQASNLAAG